MPRVDRHELDGVTLAVRSWPCRHAIRPAVVLLPGTGATADDWDAIAVRLCADRKVFAVDLRGHGESDWPGTYSISLMAGDIAALLTSLAAAEPDQADRGDQGDRSDRVDLVGHSLGRVDLVGHSLGGLVACQAVARGQAPVRRLVLEDVGLPHPRLPVTPARPAGPLSFDWAVVEQVRPEIDEPDSRWPDLIASVHAPALVIGGGPSSFVPREHVAELAATLTHGSRVTIDAGHLVHATRPDEFLAELRTFLDA